MPSYKPPLKNLISLASLRASVLFVFFCSLDLAAGTPPVTNGLVSSWTADDGTANDSYGPNHGTLKNGASTAPGKVGLGFLLDGVDDFVEIPDSPSVSFTSEMTVVAWIKSDAGAAGGIVSKYDSSQSQVSWAFTSPGDSKLRLTLTGPNGASYQYADSISSVLPVGILTHVAATFVPNDAANGIKLYVNGERVDAVSPSDSTVSSGLFDSTTPVRIGAYISQDGSRSPFGGVIDEVAIFSRALTDNEVRLLAKTTATVTLGNLSQTYDGNPKSATATTAPADLAVIITYDGSATAPTAAGSYAVLATVNDPNYTGSAAGTLIIAATAGSPPIVIGTDGETGGSGPLILDGGTLEAAASATATSPIILGPSGGKVDTAGKTVTLAGIVSGAGALVKQGPGTLRLSAENTYQGGTKADRGTVEISKNSNLGSNTKPVTLNKAELKVKLPPAPTRQKIELNRKIQLSAQGGRVTSYGGKTITTVTKSIRGAGTLRKSGAGTLRLVGTQRYPAKTVVKKGTLLVNSPSKITKSPIRVQRNAKMRGSGKISKLTLLARARLAPGNSPGSMSIAEGVEWQPGSIYEWEINNAAGAKGTFSGGWDWLDISGSLDITASASDPVTLDIRSLLVEAGAVEDVDPVLEEEPEDLEADLLEAEEPIDDPVEDEAEEPDDPQEEADDEVIPYGEILNFSPRQNYRWVIATAQGGINGFSADKFQLDLSRFQNQLEGGTFSVESDANNLYLVFTRLNHAPIAKCQDVTVSADNNCSAPAVIDNGSHDTDDGDTISVTQTPPGPYPVGTTQVTLTVTDNHGESSTCAATVTVIDNTAPVASAKNITVQLDAAGQASVTAAQIDNGSSDNCAIQSLSLNVTSFGCANVGANPVTLTVTDVHGNSSTASALVTVTDVIAPTIVCPPNMTVGTAPGRCEADVLFAATASDNCSGVSVSYSHAPGSAFPKGTTVVAATATDAAGNTASCSFTVTVNDTEAPTLSVPAPIVVRTEAGHCDALINFSATASDNCSEVNVVSTPPSGSTFPLGATTVTSAATDAAGNSTTKTFTVTVKEHVEIGNAIVAARNSVWIKQKAVIHSGDVNVNANLGGPYLNEGVELSIGQNVTTPAGFALRANRISIRQKSVINGDLFFNELEDRQKSTINGLQHSPLPLPVFCDLPPFQTGPAGTEEIAPKQGETVTLPAGSYRDIVLKQKSALILTGGEYNLRNLDIGQDVDVLFKAPSAVRIAERFALDQKSILGPDAGSGIGAKDIVLYVNGINGKGGKLNGNPDAAKIGENCVVRANFYVPNGTLFVHQKTSATGAFLARDVVVGENVELSLESAFGPSGSAGAGLLGLSADADAVQFALPGLTRMRHTADGAMELRFAGHPGSAYVVEASEDLETWMPLAQLQIGREGMVRFTDADSRGLSTRFYRMVATRRPASPSPGN
ncbi:MAG: HYR domain-containing protein [Verrucomicrobia bacterium]|nr:HYR domain-containing protein [Verrucomicrobiota bacterium]